MVVAYFYCRYGDEQRNSFLSIARSLIAQLIADCPDVIPQLSHERRVNSPTATLASPEQAETLLDLMLTAAISQKRTVYLVLDGLDECGKENLKKTAAWAMQFSDSLSIGEKMLFRCLLVSQDDGVARNSFKHVSQLKISHNDTMGDITSFAAHWHEKIEQKFGKLDDPKHHIARIITARAQGRYPGALIGIPPLTALV